MSSKELIRRRRINELLAALADNIPPSAATGKAKLAPPQTPGATGAGDEPAAPEAPIYRNSRTFPPAASMTSGVESQKSELIDWLPNLADSSSGRALNKIRKSSFVVGARSPSATPPYYSPPAATLPAGAKSVRTQNYASQQQQQQQQHRSELDGGPQAQHQQAQQPLQVPHQYQLLRSGSEEVALHTPVHSGTSSDYEWKRVENSRSWNNLRGMWGKRSLSPAVARDDEPSNKKADEDEREEDASEIKALLAAASKRQRQ